MATWRVRYTGPDEIEIEADDQFDAERQAHDENDWPWEAQRIEEDE